MKLATTLLLLWPLSAEAGRLKIQVLVSRAQELVTERCTCAEAPLYREAQWSVHRQTTPGRLDIRVSGGTPPYRFIGADPDVDRKGYYHRVMPGKQVITVVDALGERASRTVHVGKGQRYRRIDCSEGRPPMMVRSRSTHRPAARTVARLVIAAPKPDPKPVQDGLERRKEASPRPDPTRKDRDRTTRPGRTVR